MAHISTLLDSPAVVSLIDGKLLAEGGGRGMGYSTTGFYIRRLHRMVQPLTH